MIERDNKIEILEKEIDILRSQTKAFQVKNIHSIDILSLKIICFDQYQLQQYENEIGYCKNTINELEDNIEQYKIQINDLTNNISTMEQTVSCLNLIIFDSPQ